MYLDTAILLKLLVREPDTDHYVEIADGQTVWSSSLALTELFSALIRKERELAITSTQRRRAWRQVQEDVAEKRLNLAPVTADLLASANTILDSCHPHIALRSLDAIHLATARDCRSWPVCTNDKRMRDAAVRLALPLSPLP